MGLFKSAAEKELDSIIVKLEMNMSNNYKDNAQEDLRDFEMMLSSFKENGKIKGKSLSKYEVILGDYKAKMKGYTHKDQKPYWT